MKFSIKYHWKYFKS